MHSFRSSACLAIVAIAVLAGCATTTGTVVLMKIYRERAAEQVKSGVVVTASVLTEAEIEETFDTCFDFARIRRGHCSGACRSRHSIYV